MHNLVKMNRTPDRQILACLIHVDVAFVVDPGNPTWRRPGHSFAVAGAGTLPT
jgi:hypothetical protein